MTMAIPMTLEGGGEVNGQRTWAAAHGPAVVVVTRSLRSFFHSSSSFVEAQAGIGTCVETIHSSLTATRSLEP